MAYDLSRSASVLSGKVRLLGGIQELYDTVLSVVDRIIANISSGLP